MRSFASMLAVLVCTFGCGQVDDRVSLSLFVVEYVGPGDPGIPLQDVEVCETDTNNCVMTDALGKTTLALPRDAEISYTCHKDGHEKVLHVDRTDTRFISSSKVWLWRNERVKDWYDAVESAYPPMNTGTVYVTVNPRIPGATLDLVDATGTAFYEEEFGVPSLELEATTSAGTAGFVDVPPGDFNIEFGGWAQDCTPILGWPGDAPNRIGFPIRAGYFTELTVYCAAP